jgi:hypothetical protein
MFYERSSGEPHPGKGAGEKINVGDVKDYVELSTKPSTTGGENSTIRGKIAVQHKRENVCVGDALLQQQVQAQVSRFFR